MGAAALRKYVNGIAGMGSSGGMTGNNVYAPKEFNKETIPEKVWIVCLLIVWNGLSNMDSG